MKKRLLGLFLSIVMVVSCIPGIAFAEEAVKSQIVEETYSVDAEESEIATFSNVVEEAKRCAYKVYLPEGYDEEASYPTLYLMPYDGYSAEQYIEDGIQARLDELMAGDTVVSMVVVMPEFEEGDDYRAMLKTLMADVEAKYSVIPEAGYRAILGVNVGGYMAYETAFVSKSTAFIGFGAHMGDFTSAANPYTSYGTIASAVSSSSSLSRSTNFYYLDAPNGDPATTATNGTTTIGNNLMSKSSRKSTITEYAVLDGEANAEFYLGSMARSLNGFSEKFTASLFAGSLVCTPQAVTPTDDTITATVKFTMKADIAKFAAAIPDVKLTVTMVDPANGATLASASEVVSGLEAGVETTQEIALNRTDMAEGTNTTVVASAEFLGMSQELASISLVRVQALGESDGEKQVDLMGNWYFNAYKAYRGAAHAWDDVAAITPDVYEGWDVVQPALGWWSADFASTLNGNANFGGYAWYVRTFDMPTEDEFPTEGLLLAVGKFDEANEVFVNGHYVGSNGMRYTGEAGVGGTYDGSNPWDVNNVYKLDSSFLNYGGENTIAVRMCNSSGGGGWYEGPVGVYSQAAYNKAAGKPCTYAPADVQEAVLALVEKQIAAIEAEDLEAYAATLSENYFESGFDKDRRVEQMAAWMEAYDDIKVVDEVTGVFEHNGLYNYQAVRSFTAKDASGKEVKIVPPATEEDTIDDNSAYEVYEYFTMDGDEAIGYGSHSRFYYDSYVSASRNGSTETFRVYLPEGYFDADNAKRYPTMFLMHGINSQSKTFLLDKIDQIMDEAIANGEIRETIVVIPDDPNRANSGWNTAMVANDLVPAVDSRLRTIDDARYRFTAGCSMGGAGSFNTGLGYPEKFSGVISFYGALSTSMVSLSKQYLDQYGIFMVCGNEDMYGFYNVQEQISGILTGKDVEHYHYVDNGGHDSIFYLPQYIKAIKYIEGKAYATDGDATDVLSGGVTAAAEDGALVVDYALNVDESVAEYIDEIILRNDSTTTPALRVPVEVRVIKDGVVVASTTEYHSVEAAAELSSSVVFEGLDTTEDYTVDVYASVLEDTKLIKSLEVEGESLYNYDVILPEGYATSGVSYPVVYVMPQTGYAKDGSGITEKLQDAMDKNIGMDMIIVKPAFEEGMDVYATMEAIVAEVDADYRTIADAKHRTVVGTGVGGYLAYILGLTDAQGTLTSAKTFYYVASIRGDFVSEENPWYSVYGDVNDYISKIGSKNIGNFYTYMDAPVTDKWTNMEGSSNDMGAKVIGFGTASNVHEFSVRLGSFTDEFLTESVNRVADRASQGILAGIASGSVTLTKAALPSDVETAEVNYTVNIAKTFSNYAAEEQDAKVIISVVDTTNNVIGPQELATVSVDAKAVAGGTITGTVEVPNLVNAASSSVQLSVEVLGAEVPVAAVTLIRIQDTVVDGDFQYIDLMGDWYFHYTGNKNGLDVKGLLESKEYESWTVVQPAITQWTKGFGDVKSSLGGDYFDYGIVGDGYYVRTFDLPEDFDAEELVLSIGYMDDRGEAFINGERVGATGMVDGKATGDTAWAIYSYYEIDPSVLNVGGTNTIVVRNQNDGIGGGGWYGGPVALYSKLAFESDESTSSLFTEYSFDSKYAASAQGKEGTVENKYLVYLPEGYEESDKYYPTVYLMHQYNSDHTSYIIDDVDTLINEASKAGVLDDMIVVVPNSAESSWWRGDWMKMVTEELVPLIDSQYRTIDDARYRFTAGCSMGGQGAFGVALTNPDMFSGAISFFGAFSYGQSADPRSIAQKESVEYLDYYSMYFICGNQDIYGFGADAIELNQILEEKGIAHEFFVDNGEHNSVFYLPHFIEGFEYTRNNMYKSDAAVEELLTGKVTVTGSVLTAEFEALDGIEEYFNVIPASSYTKDENPDLVIPLIIEVEQDGEVVYSYVARDNAVNADEKATEVVCDITEYVDTTKPYTVVYKAAIFDRVVELDSVSVAEFEIVENPVDAENMIGKDATFTVVATGEGLTYQWQYSNANSSKWYNSSAVGADTETISVPVTSYRDGQKYRCIVTDAYGRELISEVAVMTVLRSEVAITAQPENFEGAVGETAKFTVVAEGDIVSYQWQYSNANSGKWYNSSATGATTETISVPVASYRNGQQYRCVITDATGNTVVSEAGAIVVK